MKPTTTNDADAAAQAGATSNTPTKFFIFKDGDV